MSSWSKNKKIISVAVVACIVVAAGIAFAFSNNGGLRGRWEFRTSFITLWDFNSTATLEFSGRNFTMVNYLMVTDFYYDDRNTSTIGFNRRTFTQIAPGTLGPIRGLIEAYSRPLGSRRTTSRDLLNTLSATFASEVQGRRIYRYEVRGIYRLSGDGRIEFLVNGHSTIFDFYHNVDSFTNTETMRIGNARTGSAIRLTRIR